MEHIRFYKFDPINIEFNELDDSTVFIPVDDTLIICPMYYKYYPDCIDDVIDKC